MSFLCFRLPEKMDYVDDKNPYWTSDKPGSVVEQSFILICRCRHILSDLPEHATGRSIVFCLVLLPMGFSLPRPLPCVRCALTTPFHPYPQGAVCFLCHFPSSYDAYPLDSIAPCEARTFLPILEEYSDCLPVQ